MSQGPTNRVTLRFLRRCALALALTPGVGLLGCRGQDLAPPGPPPRKVLLLGLDGASWNFLNPMLQRGALPNLAKLIQTGVHARLATIEPTLSVVIWTSIATGKSPAEHGLTGWDLVDPETGEHLLVSSGVRKVEALWTILTRSGRDVAVISWWATWPAEPVRGFVVSDQFCRRGQGAHQELEGGTYPAELASELESVSSEKWPWLREMLETGQLKVLSDRVAPRATPEPTAERWKQALFLYGHDLRAEQAAFHLLDKHSPPALFAMILGKIDVASHYMWEFLPPSERDDQAYSRILEAIYAYDDRLLGRLLDRMGPATDILIVSDHGFDRTGEGYDHQKSAPDGVFIAAGPSFRSGAELDRVSVYDVAPTILHLLGLPVARDMKGSVLGQALSTGPSVQWVDTYETGDRRSRAVRSPLEERIREQLRSLGYVH